MAESETRALVGGLEETEDRLVAGLRVGEPWAHAELCRRFGPPLHRFICNRLLGDGESAEDLMVQTLLDATRNIRRYHSRKAAFAAWVFGIARRQINLERRRQNRRKAVPNSAQVPLSQAPAESDRLNVAETAVSRLEARRRLAELPDRLSDAEMEALKLHYLYGFSVQEIAHITRRSRRATDSLLHRARRKARERLARDE